MKALDIVKSVLSILMILFSIYGIYEAVTLLLKMKPALMDILKNTNDIFPTVQERLKDLGTTMQKVDKASDKIAEGGMISLN